MVEKDIENALADSLRKGLSESDSLRNIRISSSTSSATSIYDFVENIQYGVFQDTSDWRTEHKIMIDVAGGITPDLVLRSTVSGENRIYIEVKNTEEIRDEARSRRSFDSFFTF